MEDKPKEKIKQEQQSVSEETDKASEVITPKLSPSVNKVIAAWPENEEVSAANLTEKLLEKHPEYGNNKAEAILPLKETPKKQPAKKWMEEIIQLYDFKKIKKLSGSDEPPELHGKLFLVGLGLLERKLRSQLDKEDFFKILIEEIREPVDDVLTELGAKLMKEPPADRADSVPNQSDIPLMKIEEDELGRAAFARFLSKRIQAVDTEEGAYSLHIYGPWGSGKSTLLNFVRTELEETKKWVVTDFNAWRHQHISPPWWSLMESIFQQTKGELCWWDRMREYWWRFSTGRTHYMLGLIILAWILAMVVMPWVTKKMSLVDWANIADNISKIVAVILTLWGVVVAFTRSLLFGSAKAAKSYMELTHDPMDTIKKRFNDLMKRISPKRTAVFIDDLDRCQGSYVIELLEGVQTLFREAPVVFVIAADKKWLNACYEDSYKDFKPLVHEPGKRLGMLFLEKAFQFSTPVPGIPNELKETYWQELIKVKSGKDENEQKQCEKKAKNIMETTDSEVEVISEVDKSRNKSFYEQRAIREEAVVRLASPKVIERTEHALMPFAGLLDPNPRSMKRLVNSYSVNRALATLSHIDIERDRLALWTILSLRWPVLADHLEKKPELMKEVVNNITQNLPDALAQLCSNSDVSKVLNGGPTGKPLDEDIVKQCALLRV